MAEIDELPMTNKEEINWPTHCLVCGRTVEWKNEIWQRCQIDGHYGARLERGGRMSFWIINVGKTENLSIDEFNRRLKLQAFE